MDMEPLPKVTFLPAQLTELVIKNWTGDIIDFEKNGQVSCALGAAFSFMILSLTANIDLQGVSRPRYLRVQRGPHLQG
jgi:hypothetical protein